MNDITDGGPAFPRSSQGPSDDLDMAQGMTLRDYFAAAALSGYVSDLRMVEAALESARDCKTTPENITAMISYRFADAMLEARKVRK